MKETTHKKDKENLFCIGQLLLAMGTALEYG